MSSLTWLLIFAYGLFNSHNPIANARFVSPFAIGTFDGKVSHFFILVMTS